MKQPASLLHKARLVVGHILKEIGNPDVEIFPKQDQLDGNFTSVISSLPRCAASLFLRVKPFLSILSTLAPYPDQWRFLSGISRVTESVLDDIIELNELEIPSYRRTERIKALQRLPHECVRTYPSAPKRMLREGVSRYQRVSCFRLAVHLKRIGLSCEMAQAVLELWAGSKQTCRSKAPDY